MGQCYVATVVEERVVAGFVAAGKHFGIGQAAGQQWKRATGGGFEDADPEELVIGGGDHHIGLGKQLRVGGTRFEKAPLPDMVGEVLPGPFKDGQGLTTGFTPHHTQLEIDILRDQKVHSFEEPFGTFIALPTCRPEDMQWAFAAWRRRSGHLDGGRVDDRLGTNGLYGTQDFEIRHASYELRGGTQELVTMKR